MIDHGGIQRAAISHIGIDIGIERPRGDVHRGIIVFRTVRKILLLLTPGILVQRVIGVVGLAGQDDEVSIVLRIHEPAQTHQPLVVHALDPLLLIVGALQRRQQYRRQDGDDGQDHHQLNQRKRAVPLWNSPAVLAQNVFHAASDY